MRHHVSKEKTKREGLVQPILWLATARITPNQSKYFLVSIVHLCVCNFSAPWYLQSAEVRIWIHFAQPSALWLNPQYQGHRKIANNNSTKLHWCHLCLWGNRCTVIKQKKDKLEKKVENICAHEINPFLYNSIMDKSIDRQLRWEGIRGRMRRYR